MSLGQGNFITEKRRAGCQVMIEKARSSRPEGKKRWQGIATLQDIGGHIQYV